MTTHFDAGSLNKRWGDGLYGSVGGIVWTETFHFIGDLEVTEGELLIYNDIEVGLRLVTVRCSLGVAPEGADAIFDLKKGGVSVYTTTNNRPHIVAGAASPATYLAPLPDNFIIGSHEYYTCDILQIGSTAPGRGLTLQLAAVVA